MCLRFGEFLICLGNSEILIICRGCRSLGLEGPIFCSLIMGDLTVRDWRISFNWLVCLNRIFCIFIATFFKDWLYWYRCDFVEMWKCNRSDSYAIDKFPISCWKSKEIKIFSKQFDYLKFQTIFPFQSQDFYQIWANVRYDRLPKAHVWFVHCYHDHNQLNHTFHTLLVNSKQSLS